MVLSHGPFRRTSSAQVAGRRSCTGQPLSLNDRRHQAVVREVRTGGGVRVIDVGCGDGRLLQKLAAEPQLGRICGLDVSLAALERATRRLDRAHGGGHRRVDLVLGTVTSLGDQLLGYDTATVVEVIEHVEPDRLGVFTSAVFGRLDLSTVIVTTPNVEYNVHLDHLPPSGLRHRDHRFEWTRAEFTAWADGVALDYGYAVRHAGIGDAEPTTGPPTQMAVFTRVSGVGPSPGDRW